MQFNRLEGLWGGPSAKRGVCSGSIATGRGKLQVQPCPQCPVSDGRPEKVACRDGPWRDSRIAANSIAIRSRRRCGRAM